MVTGVSSSSAAWQQTAALQFAGREMSQSVPPGIRMKARLSWDDTIIRECTIVCVVSQALFSTVGTVLSS